MARKTLFVANNSATKSNKAMIKDAESRIKALRNQASKANKSMTKTQKMQQKKLSGK